MVSRRWIAHHPAPQLVLLLRVLPPSSLSEPTCHSNPWWYPDCYFPSIFLDSM
jgi:hypothetical protein